MNIKGGATGLPPAAAAVGVNAVPAVGWLRETWSAETAMVLYYLETVAVVLLVSVMVRLIVPGVDRRGQSIARKRNEIVRNYLMFMLGFAFVIGVFIAAILLLFMAVPIPWEAVGAAMAVIVALQLFGYGWEAYRLRPLDIDDANHLISRDMGRIVVLHLGVLFGVFLAAVRTDLFVWPFMILKTTIEIAAVINIAHKGVAGAVNN